MKHQLTVGALPKEEVRDPSFAARTNQQIRIAQALAAQARIKLLD